MSREERRELNQHMHRKHHGAPPLQGDLLNRLAGHEELHNNAICDHEHADMETPSEWTEITSRKKAARG